VSFAKGLFKELDYDETKTSFRESESRQQVFYDQGRDYELRMNFERPLVVNGRLPAFLRDLIYESQDAFRWGLSRVVVASCRMAIDTLIVDIARMHFDELSDTTRRRIDSGRQLPSMLQELAREKTDLLIEEICKLRGKYLSLAEKNQLKTLRDRCNEVIHGRQREGLQKIGPFDRSAWSTLNRTIQFMSLLLERGALAR
jgi:hypothetical protein